MKKTKPEKLKAPSPSSSDAARAKTPPAKPSPTALSDGGKPPSGLWRNDPTTPEGKYLVKRRDGSIPEWPNFVIGAKDPAAPAALRAYANKARALGMNEQYCNDVLSLAERFEEYRLGHGEGDPDRGRHRMDDPRTIEEMRRGKSS